MAARKGILRNIVKEAPMNGGMLAATLAGMVISRKFIDIGTMTGDPDSMISKASGLVKVILAVAGMSAVKNPMIKGAIMGVGLEGGFQYLRQMTSKTRDDGSVEFLVEQIGAVDDLDTTESVAAVDDLDTTESVARAPVDIDAPQISSGVSGMGAEHMYDAEDLENEQMVNEDGYVDLEDDYM